jgi:hypothetical protein
LQVGAEDFLLILCEKTGQIQKVREIPKFGLALKPKVYNNNSKSVERLPMVSGVAVLKSHEGSVG